MLKMASQSATPESFISESVVCGHHAYIQADMDPFLGREATEIATKRHTDH